MNKNNNPLSELNAYNNSYDNRYIREIEMRYSFENDMIKAVSEGNHRALSNMITVEKFIQNIESRTQDPIRNLKNYLIIFNTLLRKGAEVGKVHPFYIHGMSSEFAKKIETCQTMSDIEKLWKDMSFSYCKLVNTHLATGYSPLINNVVMLISANISENITLNSTAEKFNVNASYLSSAFKKDTGYTFTEFVNMKRVEKAKQLLETTSMQIQEISRLCGIFDSNYFIKVFKKHTGKTPRQYREEI